MSNQSYLISIFLECFGFFFSFFFRIASSRYNWHTKNCIYLISIMWWVWTYTNTSETITTIKIIDISDTSQSFLVSLVVLFVCLSFVFCLHGAEWERRLIRTLNMSYPLNKYKVHNTILLIIGTMFNIKHISISIMMSLKKSIFLFLYKIHLILHHT